MTSAALAELQDVFRDRETQAAIASARTHPEREISGRLLWIVKVAEVVLREAGAEAEGEGKGRP